MQAIPYKFSLSDFIKYVESPNISTFNNELLLIELIYEENERVNLKFMPACIDGFSLFFVTEGEVSITIDFISYRLRRNMFYILTSLHVVSSVSHSKDFKGYFVLADRDFMRTSINNITPINGNINPRLHPVIELEDDNFKLKQDIFICGKW